MKCRFCSSENTRVVDSRDVEEENSIRRRRICDDCGKRFTTYEKIEETPIYVIKKSGMRQVFSEEKIRNGIAVACGNRNIPSAVITNIVKSIKNEIYNRGVNEVTSSEIGKMVMQRLEQVDDVAYIRFASVYLEFCDIQSFVKLLQDILNKRNNG